MKTRRGRQDEVPEAYPRDPDRRVNGRPSSGNVLVDDWEPDDDGLAPIDDSPFHEDTAERNRALARGRERRNGSRGRVRRVMSWFLVLLMVGAAVYGGYRLTDYRLAQQANVDLGTTVLTATSVSVGAPGSGQVTKVYVSDQERVKAGSPVASMNVDNPAAGGSGPPTVSPATVSAPISGVVSAVPAPAGSSVQSGDPIVTIYDPGTAQFEAAVGTSTLQQLASGMRVTLRSAAVSAPIHAIVDHVVPRPDVSPFSKDQRMALVLRPTDPARVAKLVPGLLFTATVNTRSAPPGAPKTVRVGSS